MHFQKKVCKIGKETYIHSFSPRTRRTIIIARICHLYRVAFVWCPLQVPFPYSWTAIMVRRLTLASAVEERGLFIFSCFNFLKLNCLVFSWQMWDRCFEERDAFLVHCASKVSGSIVKPCIFIFDITHCIFRKIEKGDWSLPCIKVSYLRLEC